MSLQPLYWRRSARRRCSAGIERVIADLVEDEPPQAVRRHTGSLLQAFDGSKQRPIGALEHFSKSAVLVRSLSKVRRQPYPDPILKKPSSLTESSP